MKDNGKKVRMNNSSCKWDFPQFTSELKDYLGKRTIRTLDREDNKEAAVLVLFTNKDSQPHVVLTERSDTVSTHKGQISFPGGGYDEGDSSFLETALRETEEEIGVPPAKIEILGEFDQYLTISSFHVRVYLGIADYPMKYKKNSSEIKRILEMPLSLFLNEGYSRRESRTFRGREFSLYFYEYGDALVWGMTAQVLTDLSRKVFKHLLPNYYNY